MDAVEFERFSYPADPEHAVAIRETVRGWLDAHHVQAGVAHGLLLAVSEAVDNAIVHAYPAEQERTAGPGTVEVTLLLDVTDVVITVTDHGTWTPPATTSLEHDTVEHPAAHGRGITLMNTGVDEVAIHHDHDGTTVLLRSARTRTDPD